MERKTEEYMIMAVIGAAVMLAFLLFGVAGAKTVVAFLVFAFPFYLILNNFSLEQDEKIFFALFLGLALFAMATWYLNRLIPSLKFSVITAVIVLCLLGLFWKKMKLPY